MAQSTAASSAKPRDADSEFHFDETWKPRFNPWVIAFTVTLATFMEALDSSIANVALPHIAGSLGASYDEATWVLTSYLVSNAIILPISGWIANRIGRKRFYMSCVVAFTIFSFCCGLASSLALLILFRIFQGAAGGGLQPSERAILADTFSPEKRSVAFALYGMAVVVAPAIGPTIGGWITDNYSWRWIFFLNIPVGILSIVLTSRIVEDPPYLKRVRKKLGSVDGIGLGLLAVTIGALQIMLDKGQEKDWFGSHLIVTCAFLAGIGFIVFLWRELTAKHPIIDLSLYRSRNFSMTQLVMLVIGASLYATTVMIPQFLQEIMGYTATEAGMVLSLGGLVLIVLLPIVGFIGQKVDPRAMICFGFAWVSFGIWRISSLDLEHQFLGRGQLARHHGTGHAVSVCAHQRHVLCRRAAGEKQRGLRTDCAGPQHRRQPRNLIHQHHAGAPRAGASKLPRRARLSRFSQLPHARSRIQRDVANPGLLPAGATGRAMAHIYDMMVQQANVLAYIDTIHALVILTVLPHPHRLPDEEASLSLQTICSCRIEPVVGATTACKLDSSLS